MRLHRNSECLTKTYLKTFSCRERSSQWNSASKSHPKFVHSRFLNSTKMCNKNVYSTSTLSSYHLTQSTYGTNTCSRNKQKRMKKKKCTNCHFKISSSENNVFELRIKCSSPPMNASKVGTEFERMAARCKISHIFVFVRFMKIDQEFLLNSGVWYMSFLPCLRSLTSCCNEPHWVALCCRFGDTLVRSKYHVASVIYMQQSGAYIYYILAWNVLHPYNNHCRSISNV